MSIREANLRQTEVRLYSKSNPVSGILLELGLEREWNSHLYSVILPSLLFTVMSYCGFWIDKNGVPGRAYLGSLAILININAYVLPRVPGTTWISNFLLVCLIFGVFTMIEYCILNFCTCTFNALSVKIDELIIQINSYGQEIEHEIKVLDHLRKSGVNKANDSEEFEAHIEEVNKKVGQEKKKQVSYNPQSEDSKGEDNKGEDDKNDGKGITPVAKGRSKVSLEDIEELDSKDERKSTEAKGSDKNLIKYQENHVKGKNMKIDTRRHRYQNNKGPQSASFGVGLEKLNLETEKRDNPIKVSTKHLNVIEEDKNEESQPHSEIDIDAENQHNFDEFSDGENSTNDKIRRMKSVVIRRHDANEIKLDDYDSFSSNNSPVKQDFLLISSKNVMIEQLERPKHIPTAKEERIRPARAHFISSSNLEN